MTFLYLYYTAFNFAWFNILICCSGQNGTAHPPQLTASPWRQGVKLHPHLLFWLLNVNHRTVDLKYLGFEFNLGLGHNILTLLHYLLSGLLNRIPSSLCSFPKQHVSMCYNHAGKQKQNWLMTGAVAILTHKAPPQNIPWLWRGKVQTCFSWQQEVYS